jgi:ATP-binding cassette subfamily B protein
MAKRTNEPLKEEEKRPLNKKSLENLFRVFSFMLPYIGPFIIGLIALFISTITLLAFPKLAG